MPFPTEHSARLANPEKYKRFRRENNKFGAGIHAIWGVRKDNSKVEVQAIRLDKTKFTPAQARAWLKEHDHTPLRFDPATGTAEFAEAGDFDRRIVQLKVDPERVTDEGMFEGYASTFGNEDLEHDIVDRGAFIESLAKHRQKGTWPKLLWQHDRHQPIGVWKSIEETEHGLQVLGQLALDKDPTQEVRQAREAYKLLKMGALDGISIGYRVLESAPAVENEREVNHLKKLKLYEASLVTFPANEQARVTTVKSVRELEAVLRDAGLSRQAAKVLASRGFAGLNQCDADADPDPEAEGTLDDELARRIADVCEQVTRKE